MEYVIREMREQEYPLLREFLYEAIYIPEGTVSQPRTVIDSPELQEYISDFGRRSHDFALAAEMQETVVGAVWVRVMNDYGHIGADTPSLAISVYHKYRGAGIGTALLNQLLGMLKSKGYSAVSLSVQKANYAVKMYQKAGFQTIGESSQEYIMIAHL